MRVAMLNAGPIEKFTTTYRSLSFAKNLTRLGVDVYFLVSFNKNDYRKYGEEYEGVKILYVRDFILRLRRWNPLFPYRYLSSFIRRNRILKDIELDIIHAFKPLPVNVMPGLWYAKKHCAFILDIDDAEYEMRKISRIASYPDLAVTKYFEDRAPYWCDYLTAASKYFHDKYVDRVERVKYIPNGVDPSEFNNIPIEDIRKKYGLANKRVIIYMGSMIKCFDTDWAIKAFAKVYKEYDDLQLFLIGDGPEKNALMELAGELGVKKSISFAGNVPHEEVMSLLSAGDVLLLPLRDNYINQCRCPVKIREYMLSGTPIVAHGVGEVNVALNGCAKICTTQDLEAFSGAIKELLDNSEEGKKMAEKARERALKEYTWKKLSKEVLQIYEQSLEKDVKC